MNIAGMALLGLAGITIGEVLRRRAASGVPA
jgi:hypothetical protein